MTIVLAIAAPLAAAGADLPAGLVSARILPGWTDEAGNRIGAVELVLQPGWKTYWRSPGDAGIPPSFDWGGSQNLGDVTFHWPRPDVIESSGTRTLGYHDRLVLPFTARPATAGQPVDLAAKIDFGLCDNICVPAHVELTADAPAGPSPDPVIEAALATVPDAAPETPDCKITEIKDGMQVALTLPSEAAAAAMELDGGRDIWVSAPDLQQRDGKTVATVDFVPSEGKPFPLDPAKLVLTLIGDGGEAREYRGCAG